MTPQSPIPNPCPYYSSGLTNLATFWKSFLIAGRWFHRSAVSWNDFSIYFCCCASNCSATWCP